MRREHRFRAYQVYGNVLLVLDVFAGMSGLIERCRLPHTSVTLSNAMAILEEFLKRWSRCADVCHITESSWDPKANCVVHLMNAALAEDALLQLREIFPEWWSRRDSEDLPLDISPIVEHFGGFRDGQFVAATEPMGGLRAWVWWAPWADDVTVSIRVGLFGDVTDANLLSLKSALTG